MKGNTHKPTRPISDKAYKDFTLRLTETLNRFTDKPNVAKEAISMLDNYLSGSTFEEVTAVAATEAMIAFSMIKSEIDKAIKRSQSARRRAEMRRKKSSAATMNTPQINEDNGYLTKEEALMKAKASGYNAMQLSLLEKLIDDHLNALYPDEPTEESDIASRLSHPLNRRQRREIERKRRKLAQKK